MFLRLWSSLCNYIDKIQWNLHKAYTFILALATIAITRTAFETIQEVYDKNKSNYS